ncbi:hypothetical protein HOLleu_11473 [Holothuria leucospilota]|uniref:C2H2-type domain-containing protein n=1 Tax=Holothuria leucospilota TaxID=206669 RepID=A0A9Q1HGG3_HOLLE|nr:hypothetical protein HOLleu_11473 [Holothuria leucospilota]
MFVAHPTVRLKGSEHLWQPIICTDKNCENRDRKNHVHCPLCQNGSCSTDLAYIKMHFRVKHVDEGLDCKTGFYSLKCYRHCKITNLRKEKLLKTPHWHCYKCRNAFIRKDDLIIHHLSHRVHKNNGKVTTHVVVQKDINQGMLIESNGKSYQTLAKIHPCPAKVPECHQPKNDDGHVPIFPKSYIIHTIAQPPATEGGIKVTNQSPAIIKQNDEYSLSEEEITKDNVEIQIVDTRSADVIRHSEAVATIINSNSPLSPEKNHFVLLKKDIPASLPKDSTVASKKEPSVLSQNDICVYTKQDTCKTSQTLLSQNIIIQPHSQNGQHLISAVDKSLELKGHSLLTEGNKSLLSSEDTQKPSANDNHSSNHVNQHFTAQNGQIRSPQNDRSVPCQSDEHLSSSNDPSTSPDNDRCISLRTNQCLPSANELSLTSRKDQCLPSKEKKSLPSLRDESLPLANSDCPSHTDNQNQPSFKVCSPSKAKNKDYSHMECINQKLILLAEKKQLEKGMETAKQEKNEMADTVRGMTDAISQLREENKEMSQKLSKLAEENAALRRQLNVITSAIFSPESSKSSAPSKNSSASKSKFKSPTVNQTILVTPQPINLVSKETSRRRSLQFVSRPVVRMKSILPPAAAEEEGAHQALIGQDLQASLGQKVTKVINATGDKLQRREDISKPSRPQNVLNVEESHAKDKANETGAKSNPSRNNLDVLLKDVQLGSNSESLHDLLEETSSGTVKHSESPETDKSGADASKSTGASEQSGDSLLSEVFEAELETQNLELYSSELEKEFLSSNVFSSSESSVTASSGNKSMESLSYVSKDHVVSGNNDKISSVRQGESMLDTREDSSSSNFMDSAESLLEMFEASLNGEQSLGNIREHTSLPANEESEGESDQVAPSLLSSLFMSTSENENSGQVGGDISQELERFGDTNLTITEPSLVSSRFEVSPQKDFETSFFGSSEDFCRQRSLSDVLHLDENFDLSQVSDEFSILGKCFDSDLGEKSLSGYSVCPLSAFLDDDNFLLNVAREDQQKGRKRFIETDEIGRQKKRK